MNGLDPRKHEIATDLSSGRRSSALEKMSLDGERLARLETKVDLILEHQETARKLFEKHDDRLKHLENSRSTIFGIAAAIGGMSAFLMDAIKTIVVTHK